DAANTRDGDHERSGRRAHRGGGGRMHATHDTGKPAARSTTRNATRLDSNRVAAPRSEEHTSELQSRGHLVCRLLLEKKKNIRYITWPARPGAPWATLSSDRTRISLPSSNLYSRALLKQSFLWTFF